MKQEFFATRELNLPGGKELAVGDLVATIETPAGVETERALNAIRSGFATAGKPPKVEKAAKPASGGGTVAGAAPVAAEKK